MNVFFRNSTTRLTMGCSPNYCSPTTWISKESFHFNIFLKYLHLMLTTTNTLTLIFVNSTLYEKKIDPRLKKKLEKMPLHAEKKSSLVRNAEKKSQKGCWKKSQALGAWQPHLEEDTHIHILTHTYIHTNTPTSTHTHTQKYKTF